MLAINIYTCSNHFNNNVWMDHYDKRSLVHENSLGESSKAWGDVYENKKFYHEVDLYHSCSNLFNYNRTIGKYRHLVISPQNSPREHYLLSPLADQTSSTMVAELGKNANLRLCLRRRCPLACSNVLCKLL